MSAEPCRGLWIKGRNQCPCARCRRIEAARSDYITANEHVARLHNQGADPQAIEKAEAARERVGQQWQEAAA